MINKKSKLALIFGLCSVGSLVLALLSGLIFKSAIVILVLDILGIISGIIGIIESHRAKKLGDKSKRRKWGLATSIIGIVISVVLLIGITFLLMIIKAIGEGFAESFSNAFSQAIVSKILI